MKMKLKRKHRPTHEEVIDLIRQGVTSRLEITRRLNAYHHRTCAVIDELVDMGIVRIIIPQLQLIHEPQPLTDELAWAFLDRLRQEGWMVYRPQETTRSNGPLGEMIHVRSAAQIPDHEVVRTVTGQS